VELKRLTAAAISKARGADLSGVGKVAGQAVGKASQAINVVEAGAKEAQLTNRRGQVSKVRLARAALRPKKTARGLVAGASAEIQRLREQAAKEPPTS
jgi:hypothetical protein